MMFFVEKFEVFLLVLVRVISAFSLVPFFGGSNLPAQVRIGFAFGISVIIFPLVEAFVPPLPREIISLGFLIINQVLIGLIMGFSLLIIFSAFQLAGQFFSFPMGFGIVNVFDPFSSIQVPIIGQLLLLISFLVFLSIDGHHLLIKAIAESFRLVPIMGIADFLPVKNGFVQLFGDIFIIAFKMAIPILGVLLLMDVSLALLAKAAPQTNVFIIGFPLKIGVGLISLILVGPIFYLVYSRTFDDVFRFIGGLLVAMSKI